MQSNHKKTKKVHSDVKTVFKMAAEYKINLAATAKSIGKSRFHAYKVRDGFYYDQELIIALIQLINNARREERKLKAKLQKLKK